MAELGGDIVTAPGASCATQLVADGEHPWHPIELLAAGVTDHEPIWPP